MENEVAALREKITIHPEVLVGIVRGGVVPTRLLSNHLNVPTMYCISVEKRKHILTEIIENLEGKMVLLIEDAIDTGRNLIMVKKYLEGKGATVKTACLYTTSRSEIAPDYFLRQVDSIPEFPWE